MPRQAGRNLPFKERFRKNRTEVELVDSTAMRGEINIIGALDFDPDGDLDAQDPLKDKAGWRLVVNADETGFKLEAP